MEFEYNPAKSESNKKKHGIDFIKATALWEDMERLEIPARTEDEFRSMVIGKIDGKYWSAVITYRNNKVRIISVRKSHKKEVKLYES